MFFAKLNRQDGRAAKKQRILFNLANLAPWRLDTEVEKMEIAEKVKTIVTEQLGVDSEEVTEEASFIEDLGADSLDTVELVMAFEEEFGIVIPDEDADKIRTVGEAIKYIEAHV